MRDTNRGTSGEGGGPAQTAMRLGAGLVVVICLSGSLCRSPAPTPTFDIQNISNNPSRSSHPSVTCDRNGRVALAWSDDQGGQEDIWLVEKSPASAWSEPVNISGSSGGSRSACLSYDEAGVLHLAWSQYVSGEWDIVYTRRSSDSTWATPETIRYGTGVTPTLGTDDSGRVHLLYEDIGGGSNVCYTQRSPNGDWLPVRVVRGEYGAIGSAFCTQGDGTCHVVWGEYDSAYVKRLLWTVRGPSGVWSDPVVVFETANSSHGPVLASEGQMVSLVFFEVTGGGRLVLLNHRETGWSLPDTTYGGRSMGPAALGIDVSGVPVVAWKHNYEELRLARRSPEWCSLVVSDSLAPASAVSLALGADGRVHLGWDHEWSALEQTDVLYAVVPLDSLEILKGGD